MQPNEPTALADLLASPLDPNGSTVISAICWQTIDYWISNRPLNAMTELTHESFIWVQLLETFHICSLDENGSALVLLEPLWSLLETLDTIVHMDLWITLIKLSASCLRTDTISSIPLASRIVKVTPRWLSLIIAQYRERKDNANDDMMRVIALTLEHTIFVHQKISKVDCTTDGMVTSSERITTATLLAMNSALHEQFILQLIQEILTLADNASEMAPQEAEKLGIFSQWRIVTEMDKSLEASSVAYQLGLRCHVLRQLLWARQNLPLTDEIKSIINNASTRIQESIMSYLRRSNRFGDLPLYPQRFRDGAIIETSTCDNCNFTMPCLLLDGLVRLLMAYKMEDEQALDINAIMDLFAGSYLASTAEHVASMQHVFVGDVINLAIELATRYNQDNSEKQCVLSTNFAQVLASVKAAACYALSQRLCNSNDSSRLEWLKSILCFVGTSCNVPMAFGGAMYESRQLLFVIELLTDLTIMDIDLIAILDEITFTIAYKWQDSRHGDMVDRFQDSKFTQSFKRCLRASDTEKLTQLLLPKLIEHAARASVSSVTSCFKDFP